MKITETYKDDMTFLTDDGNSYPLFDESVDSSVLNEMIPVAEKMLENLKEEVWKRC